MKIRKQTHTYKTVGSCRIHADVLIPVEGKEPRPVVLWLHGGALILGDRTSVEFGGCAARYLQDGYTVVSIDYRLAPESKLPEIVEDLRDAWYWLWDKGPRTFGGNRDRMAVVGHSAGGYLALLSGHCVKPRPRAIVSFYGYGDIVGDWYAKPDAFYCRQPAVPEAEARQAVGGRPIAGAPFTAGGRSRFYLYCRQNGLWPREVLGRDPEREPDAFAPFCPVRHVTKDYPPTLLLHGDQDTDVPHEESVRMAAALEAAGVEHKLITVRGAGHGFDFEDASRPAVAVALERVRAFLHARLT